MRKKAGIENQRLSLYSALLVANGITSPSQQQEAIRIADGFFKFSETVAASTGKGLTTSSSSCCLKYAPPG